MLYYKLSCSGGVLAIRLSDRRCQGLPSMFLLYVPAGLAGAVRRDVVAAARPLRARFSSADTASPSERGWGCSPGATRGSTSALPTGRKELPGAMRGMEGGGGAGTSSMTTGWREGGAHAQVA